MAAAKTHTVAKLGEILGTFDLQYDDTQNVILRVEAVFATASLPRPSEFGFFLFRVSSGDGF
jgi:hypothetical protein